MRKLLFMFVAACLLLAAVPAAHARNQFWPGVAVGALGAMVLTHPYPQPPPRVYYAPPPAYGYGYAPMYYQPYGYAPPPRMCWDHWRQDAWGTHYLGRTCR